MSSPSDNVPDLDKKKKREILELKVNELSMVDRPAILRDYLVVKRLEEEPMGAFADEGQNAGIEVEKALPAELKSAITSVVGFLNKNKSAEGAPTDDIARIVTFLGKVGEGKYPYPSPTGVAKGDKPEDQMTDDEKKKKEEAAKAAASKPEDQMTDEEKAKAKAEAEKKKAEEAKTKSQTQEGFNISISPTGEVVVSGQPVAKGKSQFTDDRTGNLKDAVTKLIGMLAEVNKSAAQELVESLLKAQLPGEVKWAPGTKAEDANVKKQLETVLEPIAKSLEGLNTRLEQIEKQRPAPNSNTGDSTETTDVAKRDNVWSGLPLPR
jgi:hypothetical protein